jgi:hypothetical protein
MPCLDGRLKDSEQLVVSIAMDDQQALYCSEIARRSRCEAFEELRNEPNLTQAVKGYFAEQYPKLPS